MELTFIVEGITEKEAGDLVLQIIQETRDWGYMITDYRIDVT